MKKMIILTLAVALFLSLLPMSSTMADTQLRFEINGESYTTPDGEPAPYINADNRTMVPVRFFANALDVPDAQIGWNQATQTATIQKGDRTVSIALGARIVLVNGNEVEMDTQAEIQDGRVFIPARFIAEGLGATVGWDQATQTVILTNEPVDIDFEIPGDEVFDDPDLQDMASTDRFDFVNGKLVFDHPGNGVTEAYEDYELKESLNPDINEQVKNVTKVLLDEDHYVQTIYAEFGEYPRLSIKFAISQLAAYRDNTFFSYLFYEQKGFDVQESWLHEPFSDNAAISLTVKSLWWEIEDHPYKPIYVEKLHDSLLAAFGEQTGMEIFNYVIGNYHGDRIEAKEVNVFGNIQVDYVAEGNATQSYYFTYLQGDQQ